MAVFEFDFKKLDRYLDKAEKDIKKRAKLGKILSLPVYGDIIDHFSKEVGPNGKWPAWSKSYLDAIQGKVAFRYINGQVVPLNPSKYKIKPPRKNGKKLQATGRLRQSITPKSWRNVSDGYLFYNNAQVRSGFPYAKAHDEGGPKLPQRKFMWLSNKGMDNVRTVALGWMKEIFE